MSILIKRDKAIVVGKGVNALVYINFFLALAASIVNVVWVLIINGFVNSTVKTGIISGFFSFISFLCFFFFVPLIEKSDKRNLFAYSLIFTFFLFLFFSLNRNFYMFIFLGVLLVASYAIRANASGILLKDNSKKKELAKNEGLIYTFLNLGWIIGPLIGAYIASKYSVYSVFIASSLFIFVALFVFSFSKFKEDRVRLVEHKDVFRNLLNYFRNKKRIIAYIIGGSATGWWILIYLFMPLFIINSGFGAKTIGLFLFLITIPLILLEYRFGKLTQRYGYRKMFLIGSLIVFVFSVLSFFTVNIYYIFSFLILASFGMALLEPTSDAYFLSIISRKEIDRFLGPYNTSKEIFQIIGKFLPSLALLFLPFKSVFLIFALFTLMVFLASLHIGKDEK